MRLRVSPEFLQAVEALRVEEIGSASAEGAKANFVHREFIDSLGG